MNYLKTSVSLLLIIGLTTIKSFAQAKTDLTSIEKAVEKKAPEKLSFGGYIQVRYNRLLETNENLGNEQGDRSWGKGGGFFIRRARLKLSSQISKQVYFYVQPDLASSPSSTSLHFAQIRDAYFDIGLDSENEFRFRIGQGKIPFGFENLQSSQNRLSLDRNDALNSPLRDERDLGVIFYYTPKKIQERFKMLVKDNYKGSGDYGIFGLGIYNGQNANRPELNDNKHIVARVTYPFVLGSQIIEPGFQAFTGKYHIAAKSVADKEIAKRNADLNYLDQRAAGSLIIYPRPFGLQVEYNMGVGPEYNKATDSIESKYLYGGYALLNYRITGKQFTVFPFVKYQNYHGGKKTERDARSYDVEELEVGVEWQFSKAFELVAQYTMASRQYEDASKKDNLQEGRLLRLQAQINF